MAKSMSFVSWLESLRSYSAKNCQIWGCIALLVASTLELTEKQRNPKITDVDNVKRLPTSFKHRFDTQSRPVWYD